MKQLFTFYAFLLTATAFSQTQQTIGVTTVTIDTLTNDMEVPWEIRLENNEFLWVTERKGLVSRVNLETGNKAVVLNLAGKVYATSEAGLLGMALHPDFVNTPEVFLVYTHGPVDGDGYFFERLEKYTFEGGELINPVILIDDIPAWINHAGSRLWILPDNTLLMSTGERYEQPLSQDPNSLAGKYLRVNTDGSIPADNPTEGSLIYTMGHRNSQGICALPDGKLIISEHGPNTDDELSVLEPGNNYGWPLVHGFCDESFEGTPCATGDYTEPIHAWTPTIATSDLVYYQNEQFPEWNGRLLMTTLKDQKIVAMKLNVAVTDVIDEDHYLTGQFGRLRDIAIGNHGEIFIATNTGSGGHPILRIKPPYTIGIDELDQLEPLTVIPNPAKDAIRLHQQKENVDLSIVNTMGQIVQEQKELEPGHEVNLQKLPPGNYYIKLTRNNSPVREEQQFTKN